MNAEEKASDMAKSKSAKMQEVNLRLLVTEKSVDTMGKTLK